MAESDEGVSAPGSGVRSAFGASSGNNSSNQNQNASTSSGGGGAGERQRFPEDIAMPPPSCFPLNRTRSPQSRLGSGRTPTAGSAGSAGWASSWAGVPGGTRPLRSHRLSAEDEAAVEAAVEIGFLLTQYSQPEADLLLQTLHKEGNLNIFSSTAPTPRLDTSRFSIANR